MLVVVGVALLAVVVFSLIGVLLAWTEKTEDKWDTEDNKN